MRRIAPVLFFGLLITMAAPYVHAQETKPQYIINASTVRRAVLLDCPRGARPEKDRMVKCLTFLRYLTNDREITRRLKSLIDNKVPVLIKDSNGVIGIDDYGSFIVPVSTEIRKVGEYLGIIYVDVTR